MKLRVACLVLVLTSVLLLLATGAYAGTGPARLLKDINPTPSSNRGSYPDHYQRLGGIALFQARTPRNGMELWRTDGTDAGTFLVKDIFPGWGGAFDYPGFYYPDAPFVEFGGALLFLANDGVHGFELWRTDGTEAGTRMVKEISSGFRGSFDAEEFHDSILFWQHVTVGGTLYFLADDGVHGFELWRTDGTEAGTWMVSDIVPGPGGAFRSFSFTFPLIGADVGGTFFFRAHDGIHGDELWKTDGTPAGTVQVKDIYPGPSGSYPGNLLPFNGTLLFAANDGVNGQELWKSDGTEAGTVLVKDIAPWPGSSNPNRLIRVNDIVLFASSRWLYKTDGSSDGTVPLREFQSEFSMQEWNGSLLLLADDGTHGRELWRSDGTQAGTILVKDISPGTSSAFIGFGRLTEAAEGLFFAADDGVHGVELWASDGTEAGTVLVKDMTQGPAGTALREVIEADGSLFLIEEVDYYVAALWKSDGTEEGTRRVNVPPSYAVGVGLHGSLLFSADDGTHGYEIWKSDGTDTGTVLVKDVNPSFVTNWSDTQFMGAVSVPGIGERMFFSADDGEHGRELWVSDGTQQGTRLVKDIYPGESGTWPSPGIVHDGAIFFAAVDVEHGLELWRSDGTEAGTVLVADILPGPEGSMWYLSTFAELNGSIYFAADDGVHGRTLWKSDGTQVGTTQVANVDLRFSFPNQGSTSVYPLAIGDILYFTATDPVHGFELWKTDGTEAGTVLVKDIAPGSAESGPSNFANLNGKLFLIARTPENGYEPWLSDGTEAGTFLIKDVFPGRTSSQRRALIPMQLGGSIYFAARSDGIHGEDLWKTDGTEAGTLLVKDVSPGVAFSGIDSLAVLDGTLFFPATSGDHVDLWRSDGTEEGTVPVKTDLTGVYDLQAIDGGLLFASTDSDHGLELWRSDGTEQGTVLAQDLAPGPDGSYPRAFTLLGNRVFFMVYDEIAGEEPWVAHTAILLGQPDRAVQDLKDEVLALHLEKGAETSLMKKLAAVGKALSTDRTIQALEDFIKHVEVLSPRRIAEASAAELEEFAGDIIGLLQSSPAQAVPSRAPEINTGRARKGPPTR